METKKRSKQQAEHRKIVKQSYWQRHKRFLQTRLREMSKPLRICFSNSSVSLTCFAHQCHGNGTPHFPGIIKYSLNVARWPIGPAVTLLRETEMGPQDKALPSGFFFPVFRKAAGHSEQETREPMRNFDMKWCFFEKWSNYSGLESCKHLLSMMYVLIVTQKQSHMPKCSKCILNVLFSLYNNSDNDLFIDNGKTFNNWPRSVQGISSSWLGIKPPGNISLLCSYCLIIYPNYHNRLYKYLLFWYWHPEGVQIRTLSAYCIALQHANI